VRTASLIDGPGTTFFPVGGRKAFLSKKRSPVSVYSELDSIPAGAKENEYELTLGLKAIPPASWLL
jgi:hypothetical protein